MKYIVAYAAGLLGFSPIISQSRLLFENRRCSQAVVAHAFNPIMEAEAGGSLSPRPVWSKEQVSE